MQTPKHPGSDKRPTEDRNAADALDGQDAAALTPAEAALEQQLRARLAETYDPVLEEPVPERLRALFHPAGQADGPVHAGPPPASAPVQLDVERRRRRGGWMAWGGMAASLVLGVLIGAQSLSPEGELARSGDGRWLARGALAKALDAQVAGAPEAGAATQVGMSFLSHEGTYCRAFQISGGAAGAAPSAGAGSAGLACRDADGWRVRQLAAVAAPTQAKAPSAADGFRTAASVWPQALLAEIDDLREGDVLTPQAEREAITRRWQR